MAGGSIQVKEKRLIVLKGLRRYIANPKDKKKRKKKKAIEPGETKNDGQISCDHVVFSVSMIRLGWIPRA